MNNTKIMEQEIKELLFTYGVNAFAQTILASWVAYESLKMNHLYEDLGFKSRTQMAAFMQKNYPRLAAKKPKDKLWKKFLYDEIGRIAPACITCDEQHNCFKCIMSEMSA
ncbi:MAG TPA: hydrogenase [Sulfurimonas sp. UBA12504]|nr:MAG: hydrogenase [Sulfurimonas sp. GWF2_37_8]DAB30076.1 MAG TPA: hydrogenase [Sulfurimonas sp. UBA12504]